MKPKTKQIRTIRNFPLHDAVVIKCSEKGFSLLQWNFNSEISDQILKWRNSEINTRIQKWRDSKEK